MVDRNPDHYYVPSVDQEDTPWLLVSFVNQWFNVIDLKSILKENQEYCPFEALQLRWLYPSPPQKLYLSRYLHVLRDLDFNTWAENIVPNFDELSTSCHCQKEFPNEPRLHNHVATGNLENVISDNVILDRLLRGPDFRETPGTSFPHAIQALEAALVDTLLMNKDVPYEAFDFWRKRVLASFKRSHRKYTNEVPLRQQHLDLMPAPGKIGSRKEELEEYFSRYTFLLADKSRGNFFMVCNNLYKMVCVKALMGASDYQRVESTEEEIGQQLRRDLAGLLHPSHLQFSGERLPYFYMLPKAHKQPLKWRPVAACQESVLEALQRVLSQCLLLVFETLRDHHQKELELTGLRKWWIVVNSLEYVLKRPEVIGHIQSSDIDSMFSKMDQTTVRLTVNEVIRSAAQVVQANGFYVVLYNTVNGNHDDEASWYDTISGLDPVANTPPVLKRTSKGVAYSLERICELVEYVVQHTYVTLGSSVHHQIKGVPQGGHSSSFLANLTCYYFEKRFVEQQPWHSLQWNVFRFCDDFQLTNVPYFLGMYRDIYPETSGIVLIPNDVTLQDGRIAESNFLDTVTFVTENGEVHITLYDKRASYAFSVNRFPDINTNASRSQSHSVFYGELVRMFRINTHIEGFVRNAADTASYLIHQKGYDRDELFRLFRRFVASQKVINNPRMPEAAGQLWQQFLACLS